MSYGWVKQLYLSDCCLLNPRVTDKHGDRTTVVELCVRRPGRCVRNPRRTEDPSKTAERYRWNECPLNADELLIMVSVQVLTMMSVECVSDTLLRQCTLHLRGRSWIWWALSVWVMLYVVTQCTLHLTGRPWIWRHVPPELSYPRTGLYRVTTQKTTI